jgi:hypothetical protein
MKGFSKLKIIAGDSLLSVELNLENNHLFFIGPEL